MRHSNKAATSGVRNWIGRTGEKTPTFFFLFNHFCILIEYPVLENPVQGLMLLITLLLKPAPIASPSYGTHWVVKRKIALRKATIYILRLRQPN